MPKKRYFQIDGDQLNEIRLGEEIGEGGEAKVFHLDPLTPSQKQLANQYVVKIYEESSGYGDGEQDPAPKLRLLGNIGKTQRKLLKRFQFPKYLVCNENRRCVGFLMPFCSGYSLAELFECFVNRRRPSRRFRRPFLRDIDRKWTRVELATLAIDILNRLTSLHKAGILMSDINTSNILVNEELKSFFIDVDSYQVGNYPCPMFHHEYASPRMMAIGCPPDELLNSNDENYSIAVLLFQVLFLGLHPYAHSGKGSLEQSIMERDFAYPLTYDLTKDIPGGPWQNIWFSLPFAIREAFHNVFSSEDNNYPNTETWLQLFEDYKEALVNNRIKRDVFPTQESILSQDDTFLGHETTDPDPSCQPELRHFDTVISEDAPSRQFLFIEFGSDSIRSWKETAQGIWKQLPFNTRHFELIDQKGRMDTDRFALRKELHNLMPSIRNIKQFAITDVRAFGGICLRNLANRDEVVDTLRQVTGLNIGILSSKEEADCLIEAALKEHPLDEGETISLVDVGGFATDVITRSSQGDTVRHSLPRLGSLTLANWLFSTYSGDHRIFAALKAHDDIVDKLVCQNFPDMDSRHLMFIGALCDMIPKKQAQTVLTLEELEHKSETLTKELCNCRLNITELGIDFWSNNFFAHNNTKLRLALPIYICIMRKIGIKQILVPRIGLGNAYINHYLTSIQHA